MNILNLHVKKATLSQKHSLVKESPHVFYPSFLLVLCILDIIRLAREQDIPVTDIPHVSALCHITLHIAPPIALIYVNNSFFFPVPFLYYIYAIADVRADGHPNKKQNKFSPARNYPVNPYEKRAATFMAALVKKLFSDIERSVITPVDRIGNC